MRIFFLHNSQIVNIIAIQTLSKYMQSEIIAAEKLPNGYCAQIARMVKTSRHYVSQVLANPEKHNGKTANRIKQAAQHLKSTEANIAIAIFNPEQHEQSK